MRPYLGAYGLILGHGAGMAHAMWLRRNATVIEVRVAAAASSETIDGLRCLYKKYFCNSLLVVFALSCLSGIGSTLVYPGGHRR